MGHKHSARLESRINRTPVKCEYCGRAGNLSAESNCQGCAAPLPMASVMPAMAYDPEILSDAMKAEFLLEAGHNIPETM